MFIPFGCYLRYYFKCNLEKVVIGSFLLSLFFEVTQLSGLYYIYPYQYRVFDVDDLIINTLGGIIGYFIMGFMNKFLPKRERIDIDSLKEGHNVSGGRRITVFCFDTFIFLFMSLFIQLFSKHNILFISFCFYFLIVPYIFKEGTIGSKFLNVEFFSDNYKELRIMFRSCFLYFYYVFIPYKLVVVIIGMISCLESIVVKCFLLVVLFIVFLIFYLVNIFTITNKREIFYDRIFKINFKSTI